MPHLLSQYPLPFVTLVPHHTVVAPHHPSLDSPHTANCNYCGCLQAVCVRTTSVMPATLFPDWVALISPGYLSHVTYVPTAAPVGRRSPPPPSPALPSPSTPPPSSLLPLPPHARRPPPASFPADCHPCARALPRNLRPTHMNLIHDKALLSPEDASAAPPHLPLYPPSPAPHPPSTSGLRAVKVGVTVTNMQFDTTRWSVSIIQGKWLPRRPINYTALKPPRRPTNHAAPLAQPLPLAK